MIKFILFLFPVTLLATEIDLSGLNIEKAKEDTKKINAGGSISGDLFVNFVVDTVESIKNAPPSNSYNQNNYVGDSQQKPNNKSSPKRSSSAYVTSIENKGNYTVVKCSKGKDTKIYQNYGECSDNYRFGSFTCSSVMKWAKERCNNR